MIDQTTAERNLAACLLRQPDEDYKATLARIASLPLGVSVESVSDGLAKRLLQAVFSNSERDIATTPQLAAQQTGVHLFEIGQLAAQAEVQALPLYIEAVLHYQARRQVTSVTEEAVRQARSAAPEQALDAITASLSQVDIGSDEGRMGTIAQRTDAGYTRLVEAQERVKRGEPRLRFPIAKLNEKVPLVPGDCILLTAKSKIGKTSFALHFFDHNVRLGFHGLYFHLEDTPDKMYWRRVARFQALFAQGGDIPPDGVTFQHLIGKPDQDGAVPVLTEAQWEMVKRINREIKNTIGERGMEIYAAGFSGEKICRYWRRFDTRARLQGHKVDFIVVDYLNKVDIDRQMVRNRREDSALALVAEEIKRTAEQLGAVAMVVQQENDEGLPFNTRQSLHKFQVWLRIERDETPNGLAPTGQLNVKLANTGDTGPVPARLDPRFMLWLG